MQCISVVMKYEYKFVLVPQVPGKCQKRPTLTQASKDRTHFHPGKFNQPKNCSPLFILLLSDSGWRLARDVGANIKTYQVGARFEALIERVLVTWHPWIQGSTLKLDSIWSLFKCEWKKVHPSKVMAIEKKRTAAFMANERFWNYN